MIMHLMVLTSTFRTVKTQTLANLVQMVNGAILMKEIILYVAHMTQSTSKQIPCAASVEAELTQVENQPPLKVCGTASMAQLEPGP